MEIEQNFDQDYYNYWWNASQQTKGE